MKAHHLSLKKTIPYKTLISWGVVALQKISSKKKKESQSSGKRSWKSTF